MIAPVVLTPPAAQVVVMALGLLLREMERDSRLGRIPWRERAQHERATSEVRELLAVLGPCCPSRTVQ